MIVTWVCRKCGWANDNNDGPCRKYGYHTEERQIRGKWRTVVITPQLDPLSQLARAVLLFHSGQPWTGSLRNEWLVLTGEAEATTRVLCDLARRLLAEATAA